MESPVADWASREYFASPFVFREAIGKYYCSICDWSIIGDKVFNKHIQSELHTNALRQHGIYISPHQGDLFYCSRCECIIPRHSRINLHIRGRKHNGLPNDEPVIKLSKLQPTDWTSCKYFACPFISHENIERYYCLLCGYDLIGNKSFMYHIKGERHIDALKQHGSCISLCEKDYYYCSCCDCFIPGYKKIRTHIRARRHQKLLYEKLKTELKKPQQIDSSSSNTSNEIINLEDSGIEESPPKEPARPERKRISAKTTYNIHKVVELLDTYEDIYDMEYRVREIKLSMELCLVTETKENYCIVCRQMIGNTLEKSIEHLCDLNHCDDLEGMLNDHARFKPSPGEFSKFCLAYEYMESMANVTTRCLVCNEGMSHIHYPLQNHIDKDSHRKRCEEMHTKATQNFGAITSRMHCDWYKIQRYRCVPCSLTLDSEIDFAVHLESKEHVNFVKKLGNTETGLIYDFCELCALLWYGYRCTYTSHCDSLTHKWFIRHGYNILPELPESARHFLAKSEIEIEETITHLNDVFATEGTDHKILMKNLVNAVKSKFSEANVCTFGSRLYGLSSSNRCIDVFLGCESIYDGKSVSNHEVLHFMTSVHQCLKDDPQTWDSIELLNSSHSPIIKARHRATGVSCEISFEDGLVVDGTKLIRFFGDIFPPCQKLLLFLIRWLTLCNLSGHRRISNYALYWFVIFYLQKYSKVPSIASLIAMEEKSDIISEATASESDNFTCTKARDSCSIKELLIRFFEFYANFDFRYDVACPVLGDVVKKKAFGDLEHLPKEMGSYIVYMKDSDHPEAFRIDCAMCIQDPFMPQHNLTVAVSKVDLVSFRTYCSMSFDLLWSS